MFLPFVKPVFDHPEDRRTRSNSRDCGKALQSWSGGVRAASVRVLEILSVVRGLRAGALSRRSTEHWSPVSRLRPASVDEVLVLDKCAAG